MPNSLSTIRSDFHLRNPDSIADANRYGIEFSHPKMAPLLKRIVIPALPPTGIKVTAFQKLPAIIEYEQTNSDNTSSKFAVVTDTRSTEKPSVNVWMTVPKKQTLAISCSTSEGHISETPFDKNSSFEFSGDVAFPPNVNDDDTVVIYFSATNSPIPIRIVPKGTSFVQSIWLDIEFDDPSSLRVDADKVAPYQASVLLSPPNNMPSSIGFTFSKTGHQEFSVFVGRDAKWELLRDPTQSGTFSANATSKLAIS
ncbi:hypothetical protein [Rhodopirellula baltica]